LTSAYANILPGNEASGDSAASVSHWQVKSHLPIGFVGRTANGPISQNETGCLETARWPDRAVPCGPFLNSSFWGFSDTPSNERFSGQIAPTLVAASVSWGSGLKPTSELQWGVLHFGADDAKDSGN